MTRSLTIGSVIVVAALGTTASAGPYVGVGIGDSNVNDNQSNPYAPDGRSGRLMLGARFANVSAEGAFTGFDLVQVGGAGGAVNGRTVSAALKLSIPLGNGFEAFGRGGLLRTWLTPKVEDPRMGDYSGDGYTVSAGFEYRLNLGVAGGSLFVDYARNTATLDAAGFVSFEQTASFWTVGLTVSI